MDPGHRARHQAAREHRERPRNVAYALLSGADGWMFDGEDALGQVATMSLDNQRNLRLAIDKDPLFLRVAEAVAAEMNQWAQGFFGRPIIADWRRQLDFTTKLFRARGLHLDDRHVREKDGTGFSASIVDLALYVVNNHRRLNAAGASIVLYLPKIQTAEEAALWNDIFAALEKHLGLPAGAIKVYVLVEQIEATFQLMEIRAALGRHFVGFNTGRWDYINSVADAMAWDPAFINPNIDAIGMTYGYMRNYEDRVRRAVNTPDQNGRCALWQGGMEANIPVGSEAGVAAGMRRAKAGGEREQRAGASGKWVAHWKMVHIVRPVWEEVGKDNQLGRAFPPLTYTRQDVDALVLLEPAPRTVRGARDLLSVALQYGNAFGRGFQAVALKPADFFGNDDVLYLMEDMATGEIRLSILWEWLQKGAKLVADDPATGVHAGDAFGAPLFTRLLDEEYEKLLRAGEPRRPRRLEGDHAAHRARDRRDLRHASRQAALVHRPPEPEPRQSRPRHRQGPDRGLHRSVRAGRDPDHRKPGLRRMTTEAASPAMTSFEKEVAATERWFDSPRFAGIVRLYTARQVVEQRGTIAHDYTVAREAAAAFYDRLRQLFAERKSITTFGPYSPGQAVTMKRMGIEGIYLGGWATSAKGGTSEDPGPDLASYPLSQVPEEAATLVRALLTADRNQHYLRLRMTEAQRAATPAHDFRPFIIADADTGHGGDPHVRNLIRRFVESGVPGYHIEDQRPGTKKCGHQGGKVLVAQDEQNKRLNAARFQLDVMGVAGIIVARTDAEAANLLDGRGDERDQPFLLGATNLEVPAYKACYLTLIRRFHELGVARAERPSALRHPRRRARRRLRLARAQGPPAPGRGGRGRLPGREGHFARRHVRPGRLLLPRRVGDRGHPRDLTARRSPRCSTSGRARANRSRRARTSGGGSRRAPRSTPPARRRALSAPTSTGTASSPGRPEGFYQVRGGIPYAIAKSLAAAPFADLLWMETKTANLADAREFAEAIHAEFPEKMLAYNLSPSFSWDTTGMSDEEMRRFPEELGKLGFVFNFITYGGHQIDGLAAEELATALKQDGMLALARLQRKLRMVESPYRTPQTLVGGPRADAALTATSGRTATTMAMGKGSTQHQHLVQTEVPKKLLEEWLAMWTQHYGLPGPLRVQLRPHSAGSELLELGITGRGNEKHANVVFAPIHDRRGRSILSVRDQNTFAESLRKKRLMDLVHLFLIHRFRADSVHYVSPTEDNHYQAAKMKVHGIFGEVTTEVGQIIVADVNPARIAELLAPDRVALGKLIRKEP